MSSSDPFLASLHSTAQTLLPSIQTELPTLSIRSWKTLPLVTYSVATPSEPMATSYPVPIREISSTTIVSATNLASMQVPGATSTGQVNPTVSTSFLGTAAIAGIVIGVIVFVVLKAGCMFYLGQLYRRRKSKKIVNSEERGVKPELDGYALDFDSRNQRNNAIIVTSLLQELPGNFEAKELPDDEKFKHTVYLCELPCNEKENSAHRHSTVIDS